MVAVCDCPLGDMMSCVAYLRDLFNFLTWFVTSGYTFDPTLATLKVLRLFLIFFTGAESILLFLHLVQGVVDTSAFVVGSLQLLAITCVLALLTTEKYARALVWSIHTTVFLLSLDLCMITYAYICGVDVVLMKVDVSLKLALYLILTALPFYSMDKELARAQSPLTFVWKIWFIEAVDIVSLVYGVVKYAHTISSVEPPNGGDSLRRGLWEIWRPFATDDPQSNTDDTPDLSIPYPFGQWDGTLRVFFFAMSVNAFVFAGISSRMLCSTVLKKGVVLGDGSYRRMAVMVSVLDALTDLPVWIVSIFSRAYVGNLALTFNVMINLLSCVRGVYITLTAHFIDDDDVLTQSTQIITASGNASSTELTGVEQRVEYHDALTLRGTPESPLSGDGNHSRRLLSAAPSSPPSSASSSSAASLLTSSSWKRSGPRGRGGGGGGGGGSSGGRGDGERLALRSADSPPSYSCDERYDGGSDHAYDDDRRVATKRSRGATSTSTVTGTSTSTSTGTGAGASTGTNMSKGKGKGKKGKDVSRSSTNQSSGSSPADETTVAIVVSGQEPGTAPVATVTSSGPDDASSQSGAAEDTSGQTPQHELEP